MLHAAVIRFRSFRWTLILAAGISEWPMMDGEKYCEESFGRRRFIAGVGWALFNEWIEAAATRSRAHTENTAVNERAIVRRSRAVIVAAAVAAAAAAR